MRHLANYPFFSALNAAVTDRLSSSLFHELVRTIWHELQKSGTLQITTKERPQRHDAPEAAAIAYHAGWCIVAVRKRIWHKQGQQENLRVLSQFGVDVRLAQGCRVSKIELLTSEDDSVLHGNGQPAESVEEDVAEVEEVVEESVTHDVAVAEVVTVNDETSRSLSAVLAADVFESFDDIEDDPLLQACNHTEEKQNQGKHVFKLKSDALAMFQQMHELTESSFHALLAKERSTALPLLKANLLADQGICKQFHRLTNTDDKSMLVAIIDMFVKSKQKQMLRRFNLAPRKSSQALRASVKPGSNAASKTANPDSASILTTGTVKQLKDALRSNGLPVGGTKADLISRLSSHLTSLEKENCEPK